MQSIRKYLVHRESRSPSAAIQLVTVKEWYFVSDLFASILYVWHIQNPFLRFCGPPLFLTLGVEST